MRIIFSLFTLLSFHTVYCQVDSTPKINTTGQKITDFVPSEWTILDSASGDLNLDGEEDAALVLQQKDSIWTTNSLGDTVLTQPRILLILFRSTEIQKFTLIDRSNSFILRNDNPAMEDPYQNIEIKNGTLEISFTLFFSIGSWYVTNAVYKFRYLKSSFVLIGAEKQTFHRATREFEEYSFNFISGKRKLSKGNDAKGIKTVIWKTMRRIQTKTIQTLKAPFHWEIEKAVLL